MGTADVEGLLDELTLDEKCAMVAGADLWSVPGCERLGIPGWRVSDGPVGVRGRNTVPGLVLPCPTAMGATWDPELVGALGAALGEECLDRGVDLLLAPTVNLHRSPRGGRHFEAFSEDPELTSRLAVAFIGGVQSKRVGACVKHFVANEQEHERFTVDTLVDERTLRELYLRPFEAAVTEAGVRAVMAAYNSVNGEQACANAELLHDLLKGEWGFDGLVVSDWGAMKETLGPARAGLDLEMPGPGRWWGGGQLASAVAAGDVGPEVLDDKVTRILSFLSWRGRLQGPTIDEPERSLERPAHRALARRAAVESMVLVRNDGLLPLRPVGTLAVIGPLAASTTLLGGGSAALDPYRRTSFLEAVAKRWDGEVIHADGTRLARGAPSLPKEWLAEDGVTVELFDGLSLDGTPFAVERRRRPFNAWHGPSWPEGVEHLSVRLRLTMTPAQSGRYRVSCLGFGPTRLMLDGRLVADNGVGGYRGPFFTRGAETTLDLEAGRRYEVVLEQRAEAGAPQAAVVDVGAELEVADETASLLAEAEAAAAAADVAVVVVGSSEQFESEGFDRSSLELPAGQDEVVRRVLDANPATAVVLNCGAPVLLPWLDRAPATLVAWYPGQEGADALVDVLLGRSDPGGRLPTTWPRAERDTPSFLHYPGESGAVRYGEELYLGYRFYDARHIEPMVPFGHGCSYTTFEWGDARLEGSGTSVTVEVPVANVGDRRGTEVVQVYLAAPDTPVRRPPKALVGWAKLRLSPGERTVARIPLDRRAFTRWDVAGHGWVVDPGRYELVVAASASDERGRLGHTVPPTGGTVPPTGG